MSEPTGVCKLCGEPMPEGEEVFKYHGYSGPCPKPPLPEPSPSASAPDGGERPVVAGVVARADERLRRGRFPLENDADLIRDLLEAVHSLHHRRQLEIDKKSDANCLSDISELPAQGRPGPSEPTEVMLNAGIAAIEEAVEWNEGAPDDLSTSVVLKVYDAMLTAAPSPVEGREWPEHDLLHYYNYVTWPVVEYIGDGLWWSYVVYPQ
jgi:hypothetical protein